MIITYTSMDTFKTCRQKFKLRYLDNIVPKESTAALQFGTAMHDLLADIFNTIQVAPNETKEELSSRITKMADLLELPDIDVAKLKGLIIGYINAWFDKDKETYEVIDVEKEFCVERPFWGCNLIGKVDGILRRKSDGKIYILEHKTASIINDAFIEQKDIDAQTMFYAIAIQEVLQEPIAGAIHDILQKQQIRQKKSETNEEFCQRLIADVTDDNFTRIEVEFNKCDLDAFEKQLYFATQDMIECECNNEKCYRCTGACLNKFGACEYLKLCRGKLDMDSALAEGFMKRRSHQEISEQTCSKDTFYCPSYPNGSEGGTND